MVKFITICALIVFAAGLLLSCERKNQFTEKKSKDVIPIFRDHQLQFTLSLSGYTKGEMEVSLGISRIKKEYRIDSCNVSLCDNKKEKPFELLEVETYDAGMNSNKRERKKYRDFNAVSSERKTIDTTINIYYSIDHTFLVPNIDATKNYRVNINVQLTTADSAYKIRKSFIFKRSKHFVPIRWTGC